MLKLKSKILFLCALLFFVVPSSAEISGLKDASGTEPAKESDGLKAMIGISGGNALLADDGTLFMNLRIGLDFELLSTGLWVSSIIGDVRNYNVEEKQMVKYRALGAFVELFPVRVSAFSISVPLQIGGGAVSVLESGANGFSSEEYFFVSDMAVHFNYRITRMLEISIGGGYRLFAGIDKNNLDNMDFCTPFGELRFTVRE